VRGVGSCAPSRFEPLEPAVRTSSVVLSSARSATERGDDERPDDVAFESESPFADPRPLEPLRLSDRPSELVRSDELRPDELRPLEVRPEEPSWPPDEPFDEPRPSSLADLRLPLPLPLPPDPDMTDPLTPPEPERPELDEPPGSAATAAAVAVVTGGDSDWAASAAPSALLPLPAVLAASEREGADVRWMLTRDSSPPR